jgi:hypothetical protein
VSDPINHPAHYTSGAARCPCGRPIECIDITRHMDFVRGNVVKYVWRAGLKGSAVEDLRKARWYLDVAVAEAERPPPPRRRWWWPRRPPYFALAFALVCALVGPQAPLVDYHLATAPAPPVARR